MNFKEILILVLIWAAFTTPAFSEYVFLKDGGILEGRIISDSASSVRIRLKNRRTKLVSRSSVMRILYTDLYMGKVFVQKIDGKGVTCYMVDEDRDSYTFRFKLFEPAEFKLRRDQVLFMARGNPAGLQGKVKTDRVELKWFPPYGEVDEYRIYIKGPGDKKYRAEDEKDDKDITIKKLKSNSRYSFYVVALDNQGEESMPSNILKIKTKNIAPESPEINPVTELESGDLIISWKPASDPDGSITEYRIYRQYDGKEYKLQSTKSLKYRVSSKLKFDSIYVSAVDNMKTESEKSRVSFGHAPSLTLSAAGSFIYPMGSLGDIAKYGCGVTVKAGTSNYILPQLELDAEMSFYYLAGQEDFTESESSVDRFIMAPLMINIGYAFYPVDALAVIPRLSAGTVYMNLEYEYFDIATSETKMVSKNCFDPAAGAGLTVRYSLTESIFITLDADYRIIFEESEYYSCASASLGAGMLFL